MSAFSAIKTNDGRGFHIIDAQGGTSEFLALSAINQVAAPNASGLETPTIKCDDDAPLVVPPLDDVSARWFYRVD